MKVSGQIKKYSKVLFIYSFASFLLVIFFGLLNLPLKKAFYDTPIWHNITLFHSHFDQLCWLGGTAIAAILYCFSDYYTGSIKIIKIFIYLYIYGTLVFSSSFLVRSVGIYLNNVFLEKIIFVFMVSTSGLAHILMIILGIYMLKCFARNVVNNETE